MPATIAWVSDGEQAKPRRRRGRRRGRRAAGPPDTANAAHNNNSVVPENNNAPVPDGRPKPHKPRGARRGPDRLRTVHETSAGGLVIDGIDGPKDSQVAALIGRIDRRGRMLWSLPKGHIELGETAEQTAIREVAEETGIQGSVLAALGSIDYWFVTEGRRVHKTVHHYLMRFLGGELCDEDVEVSEVAWVPVGELSSRLAYADERKLAEVADELIDKLHNDGPSALPPLPHSSPRRRAQTHSHTRNRRTGETGPPKPRDERLRTRAVTARRGAGTVPSRLLAVLVLMILIAAPNVSPHAAAGEPGSVPFLQVRIDRVTPDVVTTTSEPVVTVSGTVLNVGDRPVRDVMVRLEHAAAVASSTGLRTNLGGDNDQFEPVADFITLSTELQRGQNVPFNLTVPLRAAQGPSLGVDKPGVYPLLVNANGTPDYGAPARLDDARFLLPVIGVPPEPASNPSADALAAVVAPDTSKPVRLTVMWPLGDRPRLAAGAPGGTAPVRLIDDELATSLAGGGRLDVLLSAVDFATSPTVDPGGQVRSAVCLAVDPDLLVTVNAMTGGYVVNDGPDAGPSTPTHPGTGQDAAVAWLNKLRSVATRTCVAPANYAQADLDALQRVGDPGLSSIATNGAGDIVDQILGITSTRGATLVGDGPLTGPAIQLLASQGSTVAIAAANLTADDSQDGERATADVSPVRYTPEVVAAPFDPSVSAALAGAGNDPWSPSYVDAAT